MGRKHCVNYIYVPRAIYLVSYDDQDTESE